jgi:4-hydroxy-tetrahydrodipicolinate synthase
MTAADLDPAFLRGSYVPLVTPFTSSGEVDEQTYAGLVELQVSKGSAGVVVTGTSGEPSLLTTEERARLTQVAVKAAAGRIGVVAATGAQTLPETLELTRRAEQAGADAVLVVTPYYVQPPQRGLVEHFTAVASAVGLPVLIYHIPGRAAVSMTVDSVAQVAETAGNLVGLKHASSNLGYATELLARLGGDFRLFCGLEELSFPMLAVGASGLMNAVGNIAPARVARMCAAVFAGELGQARELHFELFELNQAIFWDTNPIPIKYLMARLGLLAGNTHRLPMSPAAPELRQRLDDLLGRLTWLPE